jgi:pyrroloquinoline quinone biosynthesis protein D
MLGRHVRLRFDPVRQAWAMLSPERVYWPDDASRDIISRCDGQTSVADMAGDLAVLYSAGAEEIEEDVIEFVQHLADELLVRL